VKLPDFSLFKGWPTNQPDFAMAGIPAMSDQPSQRRSTSLTGPMLFASNGGSRDGGGRDDDDYGDGYDDDLVYEEPAEQPTRRAPGAQLSGGSQAASGGRGGSGGGRPRSVQYQPEERYWTEYLRIALPILGLLLMIGLLWFWALQLMNDDNGGDQPVVTEPPATEEIVAPESTPGVDETEEIIAPPTAAPPPTEEESTPEVEVEETPADGGGAISIGSIVTTTEEGVNMRSDATTSADAIAQLPVGTVLEVTDGPYEADSYTWWQVVNDATGQVGYVVDDFVQVNP
jgi:hypothetical protein